MNGNVSRRSFLALTAVGASFGFPSIARGEVASVSPDNLVSKDWPSNRYDLKNSAAATGISLDREPESTWSRTIDDPRGQGGLQPQISPPVRSKRVLFYTTDRAVIARGSADGSLVWREHQPESCDADAAPAISGEYLFTAGSERVTAWNMFTGEIIWDTTLTKGSASAPLKTDDSTVYVPTGRGLEGHIQAYDFETGEFVWSESMNDRVGSPVVVGDNAIYAADRSEVFKSISEGETQWNFTETVRSVQTPMLINGDLLLPYNFRPPGSNQSISGGISEIHTLDGRESSKSILNHQIRASPVSDGDSYISNHTDGRITSINVSSGSQRWEIDLDIEITTSPVIVDSTIIVGTDSGSIIGLEIESGDEKWSYDVSEEPISGIIGGQDAIYFTTYYSSLGGIHTEESIESRTEVQELIQQVSTALQYGVSATEAINHLATASNNLDNRSYLDAVDAVADGKQALDDDISTIESIQRTIESVQTTATQIDHETHYDVSDILALVEESSTALDQQNIEESRQLADQAASQLEEVEASYENASNEIAELDTSISRANQRDVPVYDANAKLNQSKTTFENGHFDEATSIASDENSALTTRISNIETYREAKQESTELFEVAEEEGLEVGEHRARYAKAESYFDSEQFGTAEQQMTETLEQTTHTIETARRAAELIDQANAFQPIQPLVSTVAVRFGSEDHLSDAETAYEAAEYEEALSEAQNSIEAQQTARAVINGGLAASALGSYGIYRYDGLDKIAELLVRDDDSE